MTLHRRIDPSVFRTATILVAEGNRSLRRALRDVLLGMGFPVILLAGNTAEAMRQIVQQQPNLLLLDYRLPGGNGLALTRRLRRDKGDLRKLPIILMAEAPDAALVMAARDAGVHEVVVKPLSVETLMLRLMRVLQVPRRFITTTNYIGPDRRRQGERRRQPDRRFRPAEPTRQERRRRPSRRSGLDRRAP
ncbi:response regulator [uncultured Ferrovibrio sp.]|jgi:two-component system chemotaxis response regulator CheY|uniref:response regulator n=1 Tax=uncultured Ferrovibrio sp. TaxID=1576913 RepID=UPI002632FF79|nr:response regulator [uncultured Ferrovibrio sp.]